MERGRTNRWAGVRCHSADVADRSHRPPGPLSSGLLRVTSSVPAGHSGWWRRAGASSPLSLRVVPRRNPPTLALRPVGLVLRRVTTGLQLGFIGTLVDCLD